MSGRTPAGRWGAVALMEVGPETISVGLAERSSRAKIRQFETQRA
jgi:hypothetical protein